MPRRPGPITAESSVGPSLKTLSAAAAWARRRRSVSLDAEKLLPADVAGDLRYSSEPGPDQTYSFLLVLDYWDETKHPAEWNSFSHRWTISGTEVSVRRLEVEQRKHHEELFRWEIIRKLENSKTWLRRDRERLTREPFDF